MYRYLLGDNCCWSMVVTTCNKGNLKNLSSFHPDHRYLIKSLAAKKKIFKNFTDHFSCSQ